MIPEDNSKNNVDRFTGFKDLYDKYRPEAPAKVVEILTTYLTRRPALIVDIGCGTGLSTFIWDGHADRIIGVEPNPDMIAKAREKLGRAGTPSHISFVEGYSNRLDLAEGSVDVITCSQSFHWMEPVSTLQEVSRVLRKGGVFAAYDCDWPPNLDRAVEAAYDGLIRKADAIISQFDEPGKLVTKRDKNHHLSNMTASGAFRFTKEIVFHNMERCDAERYVGLALSQGGMQTVFKRGWTELDADIAAFRSQVEAHFQGRTLDVMFSYRMRLGVK